MEIRRSYDRLISTMGFPILVWWHLYIESGPWFPSFFWQAINSYDKSQSFMRKDLSYLYFCVSSEKCSMLRDENFKSNLKCNLSLLKWKPWKASGSSFDSCRTVHLCFAYCNMWSTNLCARFSEAHGWLISDEISHPCASFNLTHLKSRIRLSVRL